MKLLMVVGSCNRPTPYFANSDGDGISVFSFDTETGDHELIANYGAIENPTYLSVSQNGKNIYANSELFGWPQCLVTTLKIDAQTREISHLDMQPSRGSITAHSSITHDGRFLLVANYQLGHEGPDKSIVVFPILEDGVLGKPSCEVTHTGHGPNPERQERSHAHFVQQMPGGDVAVADLGLDKIIIYKLSDDGELTYSCDAEMPPGSGPRHLVWNQDGSLIFSVNEIDSTLSTLVYNQRDAKLSVVGTIPATRAGSGLESHCSGIQISPDFQHLYVANRGEETIAAFAVSSNGDLAEIGRYSCVGTTPRDLAMTPCGNWVMSANQDSQGITVFRRDPTTGILSESAKNIDVSVPMCIKFVQQVMT